MIVHFPEINLDIDNEVGVTFTFYTIGDSTEIQQITLQNTKMIVNQDGIGIRYNVQDTRIFLLIKHNSRQDKLWYLMCSITSFMKNVLYKDLGDHFFQENLMKIRNMIEQRVRGYHKGEINTLNSSRIYKLIEAADRCRSEIVLCLLGKPGIGKTEAIERFAKENNRNVVHIIASQILPSEVSGMTMPNQETHSMDVFDHYRLSHMKDGDILFFDELLKGQQQVLNACLTLIQERRLMSGTKLPDVLIIAAANPLATPTQLPLEIRQRFMFVEVEWNQDEWIDYMREHGFANKSVELKQLASEIKKRLGKDDNWNTLTPRTATKLCRWLKANGNDPDIKDYINREFGFQVLQRIDDVALDSDRTSSCKQVAEKIIDIIESYDTDDIEKNRDMLDILNRSQQIIDGTTDDMSELMSMLTKLDEWEEIKEELESCKIDDSIEY